MYRNVCLIALIFLSLENVSGYYRRGTHTEPTQMLTCVHRYKNDNRQKYSIYKYDINYKQSKGITYHFGIKVEKFDNNTEKYCVIGNKEPIASLPVNYKIGSEFDFKWSSSNLYSNGDVYVTTTSIQVTKENLQENEEPILEKKYNETTNVTFSCIEYKNKTTYTQLGVINTTSNIIETFEDTNKTFNKKHDRAILCCIYYVVSGTGGMKIIRHVTKKTLLIYVNGNENDGNKNGDKNYGNKKSWQNPQTSTVSELMISNGSSTASTYPDDRGGGNTGNQTLTYIIATVAVAAVFILIASVVICKKRYHKNPKSEARVLYADLDLLRQAEPGTSQPQRTRPGPEEESPYAQIIGEMRPQ